MEHISQHLPSVNAPNAPLTQLKPTFVPPPDGANRARQLRFLLQQALDVFNIYGREPETLTNILKAFDLVLKDIPMPHVTDAFEIWLRMSATFPTPADIFKEAKERWELAKEREANKGRVINSPRPKEPRASAVPWAFLTYEQINQRGMMREILNHLAAMEPEKAREYIKYLKGHCFFPADFQGGRYAS